MKPSPRRHGVAITLASAFSIALLLGVLLMVALSSSTTGATEPAANSTAQSSQTVAAEQSRTAVASAHTGSSSPAVERPANQGSAAQAVRRAWDLARRVGTYDFGTDLVETAYPALLLTNAGAGPQHTEMHLEGAVDLPAQKVDLRMWQGAGSLTNKESGSEARYERGRAYVRSPGGSWREVEDFSSAFAPNADPLAYLAGIKNVRVADPSSNPLAASATHYAFEVDGPVLARYIRDQLEEQLRARGELPLNLTLDVPNQLRDATGDGELWVDDRGLPLRLVMHLSFPEQRNGAHAEAEVRTDFSGFPAQIVTAPSFADDPFAWAGAALGLDVQTPAAAAKTAGPSGALALVLGVFGLLVLCRRSRKLYAGVVIAVILSMVFVPLMQSERASAFFERQEATGQTPEQEAATGRVRDQLAPDPWNPHQDPLAPVGDQVGVSLPTLTAETTPPPESGCDQSANSDADADGVSAYEECLAGTDETDPDSDDDGLNDGQEWNKLGTNPMSWDTDGDQISDKVEVEGFLNNGKRWYLDPKNPDSNNDGAVDGLECVALTSNQIPGANCDTDSDSIPDVFDLDNDNDGVPDRVDLSAETRLDRVGLGTGEATSPFDGDNAFLVVLSDLQPNWPALVDIQIRPTNPDHLAYAMNVLDWPVDRDGQIQHGKGTTFTNSDNPDIRNPDDTAGSHGDMRLVPLLEITIPGTQVPLKLTDPAVDVTVRGVLSATIALTQQAANHANTDLSFQFQEAGTHDVKIYAGGCPATGAALQTFTGLVTNNQRTYTGMKLNNLADGKHALVVTQGTNSACAEIANMVTGPYTDQMIDQSVFRPYGISVQENEAGVIQIYAPLSVVSDDTGGGKTAFQARMIYWPGDANVWQEQQQMRVVWLVNMITDSCDDTGFPTWEEYQETHPDAEQDEYDAALYEHCVVHRTMDQVRPVQAYAEDWYLTGLSVREDHGLDVAVAYPNPAGLTKAAYDASGGRLDALWGLSYGLGQQFVSGRSCETAATINTDTEPTTCTDKIRDISIYKTDKFGNPLADSTISQRFDIASTVTGNPLWNIPADTLEVKDYRYPHQDYMSYIAANVTPGILQKYTDTSIVPTLLFAREERFRAAGLEAGTVAQGQVTVSLKDYPVKTSVGLSWSPFHYVGGAWEDYSFSDYWPYLADNLRQRFWTEFPTETEDSIEGRVAVARAYYMGLVNGVVQGLELSTAHADGDSDLGLASGPATQTVALAATPSSAFGSWLAECIDDILYNIVNAMRYNRGGNKYIGYGVFVDQAGNYLVPPGTIYGKIGSGLNAAYDATIGVWKGLMTAPGSYKAASLAVIGVALVSISICLIVGGATNKDMISLAMSTLSVALSVHFLVSALVSTAKLAKDAAQSLASFLTDSLLSTGFSQFCGSIKASKGGIIGAVISGVVAWASFGLAIGLGGIAAGSMAFDDALASAIAQTIATIVLFIVFTALGPLGSLIKAIIGLIDALVGMICNTFLSEEQQASEAAEWLCGGLTGLVTNLFKWLIYSGELIVEMEPDEDKGPPWYPRLQFGNFEPVLADSEQGFTVGNKLSFSMVVTNTIDMAPIPASPWSAFWWWQFSDSNLRKATFDYKWQNAETDYHDGLSLGGTSWQTTNGGRPLYYTGNEGTGLTLELKTAGLNQPFSSEGKACKTGTDCFGALYLSEAWALPEQECWGIFPLGGCGISTEKGTYHYDMGAGLSFDILPANLTDFYKLAQVGLKWALNWGGRVPFPALYDADGDGLSADTDPNDRQWDTDFDGLSDLFERETGSDPTKPDTDGDSLSDQEEARAGTNPRLKDSDGDGLSDGEEVFHQDTLDQDGDGNKTEWVGGWEFVYGRAADDTPLITRVYSDPTSTDADGDTVGDKLEYVYGYNPNTPSIVNVLNLDSEIGEDKAGKKVATDGYVKPGDTLYYTATVKNELDLRQAHGLLATQAGPLLEASSIPQPKSFVLDALKSMTVQGTVKVNPLAASGVYSLTQVAGAWTSNWREVSGEAALWLRFDDAHDATSYMDTSGSQPRHDGACVGTGCKIESGGRFGDAIRLTGSGYVHSDATVSATDYGVSFWFKADSVTPKQVLFTDETTQGIRTRVYLEAGKIKASTNNYGREITAQPNIVANRWYHVAHTYSPTVGNVLYIDGAWVGKAAYGGLPTASSSNVNIGGTPVNAQYFAGVIDDVRLWSRGLTAEEIAGLAQQPVFHADFQQVGLWDDVTSWDPIITCSSPPCPDQVPGIAGRGAQFWQPSLLSVGSATEINRQLNLSGGKFSIAVWLHPDSEGCAYNNTAQVNYYVVSSDQDPTKAFPSLAFRTTAGQTTLKLSTAFGTGDYAVSKDTETTIPYDRWTHLVLTYDSDLANGTYRVYMDGTEVDSWSIGREGTRPNWVERFFIGGYSTMPGFCGKMDELAIYNQSIDAETAARLASDGAAALHMPFDDPPGATAFQDASAARYEFSCGATDHCPSSGVYGRLRQAAAFQFNKGQTMVLANGPVNRLVNNFTVAAWVRPSTVTGDQMIIAPAIANTGGGWRFGLHGSDLMLQVYASNSWQSYLLGDKLAGGANLQPNRWYHVAAVMDTANAASFYIDGVFKATVPVLFPGLTVTPDSDDQLMIGGTGSPNLPSYAYNGLLDDLWVYATALDADKIARLYRTAPVMHLAFEDTDGYASLGDRASYGASGTCATQDSCPKTGRPVRGQVGLAGEFDGVNDRVTVANRTDLQTKYFSVGAWVKPSAQPATTMPPWYTVVAKGGAVDLNYRLAINKDLFAEVELGCSLAKTNAMSSNPLMAEQWNHLMGTYDGKTLRLYVNGVEAATTDTPMDLSCTSTSAIRIGGDDDPSYRYFAGRIDEVAVWNTVMPAYDVLDLYDYQLAWVEDWQDRNITVDNEPPAATVAITPSNHLANQPVVIAIDAEDASSDVSSVVMKSSAGQVGAVRCADPNQGPAWCALFTPSGEGVYSLVATATDLVGRTADSAAKTVYVDATAPVVTLAQSGAINAIRSNIEPTTWLLHFSGTVNDPATVAGTASGIPADGVHVTVRNPSGEALGEVAQVATISGSTWSLDYRIKQYQPDGCYNVAVEAVDNIARIPGLGETLLAQHRAEASTPIQVDSRAPLVAFDKRHIEENLGGRITAAVQVYQGAIMERPVPLRAVVTGQSGAEQSSVNLRCTVGSEVTVFWLRPGDISQGDILTWNGDLQQGATCGFFMNNTGIAGGLSVAAEVCGEPVTLTKDLTRYRWTFTVDSAACKPKTCSVQPAIAGVDKAEFALTPVLPGSSSFNDKPLQDEVLRLPLDDTLGQDDSLIARDVSGGGHNGVKCTGETCPSPSQVGRAGKANYFDGANDYVDAGNQINLANKSFTVAFWAKRAATGRWDLALGLGTSSAGKQLHLGFRSTDQFTCAFYGGAGYDLNTDPFTDLGWHHWACTYDATTNTRIIYRDGVLVKQDTASADFSGSGNLYIGARAPSSYSYKGLLDDVRVFSRSLPATEVKGLFAGSGPLLVLPLESEFARDGDIVKDTSSWGHEGMLHTGDTENKASLGQVGDYALRFDGNDYVSVGPSAGLDLSGGQFTEAAWIKSESTDTNHHGILGFQAAGAPTAQRYPSIWVYQQTGILAGFGDGANYNYFTKSDVLQAGWNHVATTFDGTAYKLYVNGTAVYTNTSFSGRKPYAEVKQVDVGRASTFTFNGSIDDVRIYARSLPSQEIMELYNSGWRNAPYVTSDNPDRMYWTLERTRTTLPQGLEGTYRVQLRGSDKAGHTQAVGEQAVLWEGEGDNLKPRVTLCQALVSGTTYRYVAVAEDYNLTEANFASPCAITSRTYFQSPWYLSIADQNRLYQVKADCQLSTSPTLQATAYDSFGNYTSVGLADSATCAPILASAAATSDLQASAAPAGPPAIAFASTVLTGTHYSPGGSVRLSGYVTGLRQVTGVQVTAGGITGAATVSDPEPTPPYTITWSYAWLPPAGALLDGGTFQASATVTTPAVTSAGQQTAAPAAAQLDHRFFLPLVFNAIHPQVSYSVEAVLTVDVVPPSPVALTLTANGAPVQPDTVLRIASPQLGLVWEASQDGSGIDGYVVRWLATTALTTTQTTRVLGPAGPYEDLYQAGEAQQVAVELVSRDHYGNERAQGFGSVVIDAPLTPDFVQLPAGRATAAHQAWMETGCSLLGTDGRVTRTGGSGALPEQRLYGSWDPQALRLSWTGANWSAAGDLFIYLDTGGGGTRETFSPYPVPANASKVLLPESMAADRLVWVQDHEQASVLAWNGSTWGAATPLPVEQYRFDPGSRGGETGLYLPFALLGMNAGSALGLLAFAAEEPDPAEGLQIWATVPSTNPVNSARANQRAALLRVLASQGIAMPLLHFNRWEAVGDAICPNGANGQTAGVQIQASVTTDPVGATASGLEGPLFWASPPAENLTAAVASYGTESQTADASAAPASLIFDLLNPEHRPLPNGQEIVYTVEVVNKGSDTLVGAYLALAGLGPLNLLDERVDLGDIPAGEERTATFHGVTDLSRSATGPAVALAQLYAVGYPESESAIEWMVAAHRVDRGAPEEIGFGTGATRIGTGAGLLNGYAFDESGVTSVTVEITGPQGGVLTLTCPVEEGQAGRWSCQWDATAANGGTPPEDGAEISVRFQATDRYGQISAWSEPRTFQIDALPPVVTLASQAQILQRGRLRLSGRAVDGGGVNEITLCVDGQCRNANLQDGNGESSRWSFSHDTGPSDFTTHIVTLQARDSLGNRTPEPLTFEVVVDNVGPALSATQLASQVVLGSTATVLQGTTSDGGPSVQTWVLVETPAGDLVQRGVLETGDDWTFDLAGEKPGRYLLSVEAQDQAGNKSTVGPFTVDVTCTDADFAVAEFTAQPSEGMTLTFTVKATLANAGPNSLPADIPIGFYDGSGRLAALKTTAALDAGDAETLSVEWSAPEPGHYELFVVPDDHGLGLDSPVMLCTTPATAHAFVDAGLAPEEQRPVYLPLIMLNAFASLIPADLVGPVEQLQPSEPPAAVLEDGSSWAPDAQRDTEQ